MKDISLHLNECYTFAQRYLGDGFDSTMADISIEVLELQSRAKKPISFAAAAMLLSARDEEEMKSMSEDEAAEWLNCSKLIKATIVWNIFNPMPKI
jgi:hypothetical protein